jgi:HK97 gp10 family phage protein
VSEPTVVITGQAELIAKLQALPDKVFRRGLLSAGKKALAPVVATAKANAPAESGALRNSIGVKVKVYRKDGNVAFIVGPRSGFAGQFGGRKRDPVYYAHIIEGGHKVVARHSLKVGLKKKGFGFERKSGTGLVLSNVPAMPFLKPAIEANQGAVVALLATNLGVFIEREAKKEEAKRRGEAFEGRDEQGKFIPRAKR